MYKRTISLTLPNGRVIPIEISSARRNGDWFVAGTATIDGSPITLTATASEAMIRAGLQKLGKLSPEASTGGFFDTIKQGIAKFARSKALQSVLQGIATVANNPMVREMASFYGPLQKGLEYIGKGASAAAAAQSLIVRAKSGDQKAGATIKTIYDGAKKGNAQAQLMHKVLVSVNRNAGQPQPPAQSRPQFQPMRYPQQPAQLPMRYPQPQAQFQPMQFFPGFQPNFGPPVSAGAALESDPYLVALARTIRATG